MLSSPIHKEPPKPQDEELVGTSQGTTPPTSSGLSDTDSGDEEGGEGKGRNEKNVGGDGRGSGATIDNRDETMGVSLGPVAQGHIVGVSCARAMDHCFFAALRVVQSATHRFLISRIALAVPVCEHSTRSWGSPVAVTLCSAPLHTMRCDLLRHHVAVSTPFAVKLESLLPLYGRC